METRGPLPPEIYRRRRIGAIVILALVIALIVWGIVAAVNKNKGPAPTRPTVTVSSTSTITSGSSTTSAEADGPACEKGDLLIEAQVNDKVTQGQDLPLIMKVTNKSKKACVAELGAAHQEYEIYTVKNKQPVWKSEICYTSDENRKELMQPGESRRFTVQWEGTKRNADGDCTAQAPVVAPGDYQLYTLLDAQLSSGAKFTVAPRTAQ